MTAFVDTSVLVAAFWGNHPAHQSCAAWFAKANKRSTRCAVHTLAEVYTVMTRLPVRPPILPEHGWLFIENILERITPIELNVTDYRNTLQWAAQQPQVGGGRIYDALLLTCARKSRAEAIYTLNIKEFRALAPDLERRIQVP